MPIKPLKIDISDAVRLYESGRSLEEVARQSGVSDMTIYRRLMAAGTQMRKRGEGIRIKAWQRYGDTLAPLVARYVAGESFAQIGRDSGIQQRRLAMAVVREGYKVRSLLQAQGLRYTRMSVSERRSMTAKANIAKRGIKASERSLERRAKTYEMTLQLASRADLIMGIWLVQRGINITPQKAIGPYNIDIAIDELLVAVEINGDWHYFPHKITSERNRRKYLFDRGWRLIEVNLGVERGRPWKYIRPSCADKIVSFVQEPGALESMIGQYCVIRGDGELLSRSGSEDSDGSAIGRSVSTSDCSATDHNFARNAVP